MVVENIGDLGETLKNTLEAKKAPEKFGNLPKNRILRSCEMLLFCATTSEISKIPKI